MIPRTVFGESHDLLRENVRKFLEAEAVPYHDQWEEQGAISRDFWREAGSLGILAPNVDPQFGGLGADYLYNAVINEEIAGLGLSGVGFQLHSDIVVPYISRLGTPEQKARYLPKCVSGDCIMAIAISEPGTGSDMQGIRTNAVEDGDDYILNGSKIFITNGQLADTVIVVAKTDSDAGSKGFSLFLIDRDMPGFTRGKNLKKLGMKAQDTSELFFSDVRVPKTNVLGELGKGFAYLMQELPQERLTNAVGFTAMCESMLKITTDYVKDRKAFGKPVAAFQNTQFKLAEMDTHLTGLRVFIDRCLDLHVQGQLDDVSAAKAKLWASEVLCRIADECVQLHGGYGYMWEYPIARFYADARGSRIYAGTDEVMKIIISRSLLAAEGFGSALRSHR